jgi:hypothetical protein
MSEPSEDNRPSFSAPLYAALRQGAKELAQALPAFPESVRPVEESGTLGNPTQAMVTQEIGTVQGYNSMLDTYAARGAERDEPDRGMER